MSAYVAEFPDPKIMTDEQFDQFIKDADDDEGWTTVSDSAGVAVYEKVIADAPIKCVKMRATLNASPAVLYDVLHDPDYRKTWDENMAAGYEIEKLNVNNDVGYYAAKSPFMMISSRDFCNQRAWRARSTEYVIRAHTVKHPDMPEQSGYVRAQAIVTGYLLRACKDDENKVVLTYMTQTDPKGWLPGWLVNKVASKVVPGVIEKLQKASDGYAEWKAKAENKPDEKPWLDAGDGTDGGDDDGDGDGDGDDRAAKVARVTEVVDDDDGGIAANAGVGGGGGDD